MLIKPFHALKLFKTVRYPGKVNNMSSKTNFEEIKIPVPWGHIAAKLWGPKNRRPILTIHGWQVCNNPFYYYTTLFNLLRAGNAES